MSILFSPLQIRGIKLKNRIVISPMCQYSAEDGFANDWHLVHLGSRAVGGAALIITEAAAVAQDGRISPEDLGIWKDEHIAGLKRITSFLKQQGSVPGIQLAHAGRKASCTSPWQGGKQISAENGGWQTISASAIPFKETDIVPYELTKAEIDDLINQFRQATIRALKAGFEVIELHGAHGYLIHQFLSPLTNKRADEYGGSFENRIRFLLEITDAVRSEMPEELPLFVRLSATDWVSGGWNPDESATLSAILKDKGVDLVDCSSGGAVTGVKIATGPGYQVPFADKIKNEAGIHTGAVGMITSAEQAEEILQRKQADLVFFARESLREAYFPLKAAAELHEDIVWPVQYERAKL